MSEHAGEVGLPTASTIALRRRDSTLELHCEKVEELGFREAHQREDCVSLTAVVRKWGTMPMTACRRVLPPVVV